MNKFLIAFAIIFLVADCSSTKQKYENKLRQRVQIAMYDSSPHAQSNRVDIYDETHAISQPHKNIAHLTCEGTPSEEAPMIEAIIYRAKMIGADGIVILPPSRSGWGDRRVFRANAVVYEK